MKYLNFQWYSLHAIVFSEKYYEAPQEIIIKAIH